MEIKPTGGMMFSYFPKSQSGKKAAPPGAGDSGKHHREAEYSNCDQVSQDTIWKQAVVAEKRCLKNWGTSWGFLAEFDAQGKPKERPPLPEKSTIFSDNVPNTNSGNYGNRVNTELGTTMSKMEYQFYSGGRRKKMGSDMICY